VMKCTDGRPAEGFMLPRFALALSRVQSVRTERASSVNEPTQQDRTTKKMRLLSHPQKLLS
jgi:hypothetical protein